MCYYLTHLQFHLCCYVICVCNSADYHSLWILVSLCPAVLWAHKQLASVRLPYPYWTSSCLLIHTTRIHIFFEETLRKSCISLSCISWADVQLLSDDFVPAPGSPVGTQAACFGAVALPLFELCCVHIYICSSLLCIGSADVCPQSIAVG